MSDNIMFREDIATKNLSRIGGVSALIIPVIYVITSIIVLPAYGTDPIPGNAAGWFDLFQKKPMVGLFYLGFADIMIAVLSVLLVLALCFALRNIGRTGLVIAAAFTIIGTAAYLSTNIAFSMLDLSRQYADAAAQSDKLLLLSAGQAMISVSRGTGALISPVFTTSAMLILSVYMLRGSGFGKVTAVLGIIAFSLLLAGVPFGGTYTAVEQQGAIETAAVYFTSIAGGLLSMIWYVPAGIKLLRLRPIKD